MLKNIYRKVRLVNQHRRSRIQHTQYTSDFKDIETFCVFIGYPRSGHTLISSLLDAHAEIILSNELNTLRHIKYKFTREQIFYLIIKNSQNFSAKGRIHTGYNYKVPNQWQGKYRKIRVIGDKRGSGSLKKLFYRPELFERMYSEIKKPIKFIHVIRNPFDNISTIYNKSSHKNLYKSINYYFFLADEAVKLKNKVSQDSIFDIRYENFTLSPKESLIQLTEFLGVKADSSYLEDCTKILFKKPKQTRQNAPWTDDLIEQVNERISKYPFLSEYTFNS